MAPPHAGVLDRALRAALLLLAFTACAPPPAALPDPTAPPSPASTAAPVREELRRSAADITRAFRGQPGIWIADPTKPDPIFTANADEPFITASLYTLAVLLHVERLVESKDLSYRNTITIEQEDTRHGGANEFPGTVMTIDEALESMITYSDNGPALAFLRTFGVTSINATLADEEIAGFRVSGDPDQDNVVTPRAIGIYLTKLAQRTLLSADASDRMLARLRRQHINDRLPQRLPAGVTVAHKTGDLVGYFHDVGIIEASDGQLIVVAMTKGASEEASYDFIARLASALYTAWSAGDPARLPLPTPAPAVALQPAQQQGANVALLVFVAAALGVLVFARRYSLRHRVRVAGPATARTTGVWTPSRRTGSTPRRAPGGAVSGGAVSGRATPGRAPAGRAARETKRSRPGR